MAAIGCGGGGEKQPEGDPQEQPAGEPETKPADEGQPSGEEAPKPNAPPEDDGGRDGRLDDLEKELSLRDQEREALARHYFEVGKRHYDLFEYQEAAENFRKAYDAKPNDAEILHYKMMAELLAGERQAEFKAIAEVLRQEKEVSIQQEKEDLKRLYKDGEDLFNAQEYDRAIIRFEQVLEKIRWFPYQIDSENFEENARTYIVRARRLQRERQLLQQEERERQAFQQAQLEEERHRQEKEQKLRIMQRRALDQIMLHNYRAADVTINEILQVDPQNEEALKLRQLAVAGRHATNRKQIYQDTHLEHRLDRQANIDAAVPSLPDGVEFPSRQFWLERVQSRSASIADEEASEPEWVKEYRKILDSRPVTLNFPDTALSEVISFLQDITGLNITLGAGVDGEETTVSLRLREILLKDALKIILEQTDLAMTFKNETLLITSKDSEDARGEFVLDIYDVQDLLSQIPDFPGDRIRVTGNNGGGGGGGGGGGQGGGFSFEEEEEGEGRVLEPDKLEEIITNSVGEDNWDEPASIEIHRGQLIVNQTRDLHREVREVLKNLRRNTGMFVQVETRFVRMTDDFLRDIGVDLRELGGTDPTGLFGRALQLDPNPSPSTTRPGANQGSIGFGRQIPVGNGRQRLGAPGPGGIPFFGNNMLGGRTQNILNGGDAYFSGTRLNGTGVSAGNPAKGLAAQFTLLDPFQLNAILRAEQENARRKIVDAPVITAANRQRVSVSVITQRAYISDYELSSGGTGQVVAEVADPIIATFQEGIVLDVRPTISSDRKYITLDLKPTLATLVGGDFRQIPVNLGTISNAAINVNIEVPEVTLQEVFTSVTIPDGGSALLGGFRQINHKEEHSGVPFIDHVPLVNKLFSRDGELFETQSILILVTARTIALREEEKRRFNLKED
ncbi:MAG TPA: hypothetical protein DEA08_38565 [Planctomycetes bacterium]|nr:hypothetical protein [Planctomycetota bacterium]